MSRTHQGQTQAQLVELSRQKGHERERLAAEAAAAGNHAVAAEHRRAAKLYRQEAEMQSPFIPGRR